MQEPQTRLFRARGSLGQNARKSETYKVLSAGTAVSIAAGHVLGDLNVLPVGASAGGVDHAGVWASAAKGKVSH